MIRVDLNDDEKVNIKFPLDQLSAFSRIRTANPYTLVDLVNTEFLDPEEYVTTGGVAGQWDAGGVGSVTHLPLQSAAQLRVSDGTSGAYAQLQTKDYLRYQTGKGLYWLTTLVHDDNGKDGQERSWGHHDDNDGVFFRLQGTELQIVKRSSVSGTVQEVVYPQYKWNRDPMMSLGPSKTRLSLTKGNIYECRRLQWLGVGDVDMYINGFMVHRVEHANKLSTPYMKSARLPMRWRVENTGASSYGGMRYICCHVGIDGGEDPPLRPFTYSMPAAVSCSLTGTYLFSIRLASDFPVGGGLTNRMRMFPTLARFASEGQRGAISLVMNPTLTGATWATSAGSTSGVQIDTAATVVTGGTILDRPFIAQNAGENFDLTALFGRNRRRLRQGDILTVRGFAESGATADIRGTLGWDEER